MSKSSILKALKSPKQPIKTMVSFRLSPEVVVALGKLSKATGADKTRCLEEILKAGLKEAGYLPLSKPK